MANSTARSILNAWLRQPLVEAVLIVLVTLTIHLVGNGRTSLWDRDEPRYAQCAREMRRSGDWIRPTFNGEPRHHKPVLIYWLMIVGTAVGGDNPFGVRLVSALAGTGTVLLGWGLGRRLFGSGIGRLTAMILATAPILAIESKLATTDATLAFLLVGCQVLLWRLNQRPSTRSALGFWALLALAVLTKGPVGPALIAASGVVSWWWGGPTACWSRLNWRWGLGIFLAIVLPWYIAIGVLTQGEFFRFAVGTQVVNRVAHGMEQHGGFPGYYAVTSIATFYPWSALLPAALLAAWKRRRERPELGFLLGWVVGPWLLLECVQTKLIHYYLPAYPACGLLVAWLVGEVIAEGVALPRWRLGRLAMGLLAAVGLTLALGLIALACVIPGPMRWPSLVMAGVLLIGTLLALDGLHHGATLRAVHGLAVTWGLMLLIAGGWLLPSAEPFRVSRSVAEKLRIWSAREGAEPVLATFQQPSVIYHFGRPIEILESYEGLVQRLERGETLVSALSPGELRRFDRDRRIEMTVRETIRGFNLDKGRDETLHLVRIAGPGGDPSVVARRPTQKGEVQ